MDKSTIRLATPLREQLDRLAAFEPGPYPVLSLYLNMRPDQHGRDNYSTFLRKAFPDRGRALAGEERKSFERDAARIQEYLASSVRPSANGVAVFACAGCDDFFEAIQFEAAVGEHLLFVGPVPHVYPLARINDQYPRYAALIVDTNAARLFVFALGATESERDVRNLKTRRTMMGGWSQARYQRHVENFHLLHLKEVVNVLDRVVRDERLERVILSCVEVARAQLMSELPPHLANKVVDVLTLDIRTPEHQVLAQTLEALKEKEAETDPQRVEALLGAWRAGGLGVVGVDDTLGALERAQVDELIITARPGDLAAPKRSAAAASSQAAVATSAPAGPPDARRLQIADALVRKAQQTNARIRFIENPKLLAEVGGVGGLLRFTL